MSQKPLFEDIEPKSMAPVPDPLGVTCPMGGSVLMRSLEGTWCKKGCEGAS